MSQRDWIFAGLALAALIWATRTQAREINRVSPLIDVGEPLPDMPAEDAPEVLPMPEQSPPVFDANDARARAANVSAFLTAIAKFESSTGPEGYVMLYGGGVFDNFADHPGNLGWQGVELPDNQCIAAGFSPGCKSYAAGRYQLTLTTWKRLQHKLNLPDFSPESQDAAARELIAENGATGLVEMGHFDDAIARLRKVWASMPAAGYAQREHGLDKWRTAYADAGGGFA